MKGKNNYKTLYHWLSPPIAGMLILAIVWFVTDPETNMYYPRSPVDRVYTIATVFIFSYVQYVLFHVIALRYFFNKRKRINAGVEYAIILFFMIPVIASLSLFATYFINHQHFSWPELIRNSGLIIPIAFIHYLTSRSIRLAEEYSRQTIQLEKTKSNQLETELKYLRAQYHPHFLFNALNTVYFQIDDSNVNAKNTVELLSELLRYQLYNIEEKVQISKEINFIKSYIRFQQLRMTKSLIMNTYFDNSLDKQQIYPLIYQPFLENALKYVGGEYQIHLEMKLQDKHIVFQIENSLPEPVQATKEPNAGIGIENARRRLALLYPDRHRLNIEQREKSFFVELMINPDSNEN
jgi:sensor histidine kinase YesM